MSNSAVPFIPADGSLTITDGGALTFTLLYTDGDFQVTGLSAAQKSAQEFKTRGKVYSVRDVEEQSMEFSFTAHATQILGDGTTATLADVILKKGPWIAATSKLPAANGDTYCVQVAWTGERSTFGATADNVVTLKYCHLVLDFAEGVPGKLSVKGTAYTISTDFRTLV
jgi:hypothetical protein